MRKFLNLLLVIAIVISGTLINAAELMPVPRQRYFDANGLPLAGGKLYSYDAGTTTPKATYTSRAGTTPNANPVILDANGEADVWLSGGYYKFVLKNANDVTQWTKDSIAVPYEAALASAFWRDVVYITSANSPYTISASENGKLISVDSTGGAVTINMPQISTLTLPYNVGVKLTTGSNAITINRSSTDTIDTGTSKTLSTPNSATQLIADIDKAPDDWSSLDIGVVSDLAITTAKLNDGVFSGLTSVTPALDDYVPLADTSDSSKKKKGLVREIKDRKVRSVTTTDSPSNTSDEVLVLSGASFTLTLPTAVGVKGKVFELVHSGTSLTQIYTLNTTSSQTIGGITSGNYKLCTTGEMLRIVSDDSNWVILDHRTDTAMTLFTPVITGTTTNPTLATTKVYKVTWSRHGDMMTYQFHYSHASGSGAVNGSGAMLLPLPTGATIDTTRVDSDTSASASGKGSVGNGVIIASTGTINGSVSVNVYNSTNFKMNLTNSANNLTIIGPTFFTGATAEFGFTATVPIVDWQP